MRWCSPPPALERPAIERRHAWFGSYITTILERDVRDIANIEALRTLPRRLALMAARSASRLNFAELSRAAAEPHLRGSMPQTFVAAELAKQASCSRRRPRLYHFRQPAGPKMDLVLEDPSGQLAGVEVKASATVTGQDFKGLRALAAIAGPRFRRGIVLYTGESAVPFGHNLHALPIATLWVAPRPNIGVEIGALHQNSVSRPSRVAWWRLPRRGVGGPLAPLPRVGCETANGRRRRVAAP